METEKVSKKYGIQRSKIGKEGEELGRKGAESDLIGEVLEGRGR